jgi:hypothetical protein
MSQRTVHRLYCDFEKEEAWLNAMAAKGLHLVHYSWGTYTFQQGELGEWIYRIQFLEKDARKPASSEYLAFVADAGVETVDTYMNWAYFRRRAASGPFELFSDLDSRIAHYQKVLTFLGLMVMTQAPISVVLLANVARGSWAPAWVVPLLVVQMSAFVAFCIQTFRMRKRVGTLERQRQVFE